MQARSHFCHLNCDRDLQRAVSTFENISQNYSVPLLIVGRPRELMAEVVMEKMSGFLRKVGTFKCVVIDLISIHLKHA